jgi:hypothetical protein
MGKNKWKKLQRRSSDNAPDVTATSVEPDVENVPPAEGTASPSEPKPPGMGKNKWKKLQRRLNFDAPDVISTSGESISMETKVDVECASAEEGKLDDKNSEVTKETTKETVTKVSMKVKRDEKDDTNSEVTKETLSKSPTKVMQSKKEVGSASAEQDKLDDTKEASSKVSTTVNHEKDVSTRRQSSRKKH